MLSMQLILAAVEWLTTFGLLMALAMVFSEATVDGLVQTKSVCWVMKRPQGEKSLPLLQRVL